MRWTLGQLDQLLSILKRLTQLLHTSLHPVHSVDALQRGIASLISCISYVSPSRRVTHSISPLSHLHPECPSFYLRDTLGDDKGDAITSTAGYLREISAKQLQTALQLLMATLDSQSLQTAFVARQEALQRQRRRRCGPPILCMICLSGSPSGHKQMWWRTHLFTFSTLEVNVAVTFSALCRSPKFSHSMCLGCFWQADVTERSRGHRFTIHAINICRQTPMHTQLHYYTK